MSLKVTVADLVSPSYFVTTAAVELGFFKAAGVDAELVTPPDNTAEALRDGEIDLLGNSAYSALESFPDWQGGKLLCALAQHAYWFLAVRADLNVKQGDIQALKGLRISATRGPRLALEQMLIAAGLDPARDVQIVDPPPREPGGN